MRRIVPSFIFLAFLATGFAVQPNPFADLHASVLRLASDILLVGTTDGDVCGFDARTDSRLFTIHGTSKAPVKDIAWIGGRPWWINEGSPFLHSRTYDGKPLNMDLTDLKLGSLQRLGVWQEMLVIHSLGKVRFLEPGTRHVLMAQQVFPKEVANAIKKGEILESWLGRQGLLVTVERYGKRSNAEEVGGITDIALINAWSIDADDHARLLGGYTAPTILFGDSGFAKVGNLSLDSNGLVALERNRVASVPFMEEGWSVKRVTTKIAPNYAQAMGTVGSKVWWANGDRLLEADLKDGSTKEEKPFGPGGQIVSLAAGMAGVFVLGDSGLVKRVSPPISPVQ